LGTNNIWGSIELAESLSIKVGDKLVIQRTIPLEQQVDFGNQKMLPNTLNEFADKVIALMQDNQFLENTIHAPIDEIISSGLLELRNTIATPNSLIGIGSYGEIITVNPDMPLQCTLHYPLDMENPPDFTVYPNLADGCTWMYSAATNSLMPIKVSDLVGADSKIKQILEIAESAYTKAIGAQTTAEDADTKATTAQTTAEAADTKATTAQTTAEAADTKATTAQTTAEAADTKATTAQTTAEAADTKATTAQTTAEAADTKATTAQTAAEDADTKATTAQTTAEAADTKATTAQTTATAADTKATTAQTTAEAADTKATTAQTTANAAQATANAALSSIKMDNGKTVRITSAVGWINVRETYSLSTYLVETAIPRSRTNWKFLAYKDGVHIAISFENVVAKSTDNGITWTRVSFPDSTYLIKDLKADDNIFAAVGMEYIYTSLDGNTWNKIFVSSNKQLNSIALRTNQNIITGFDITTPTTNYIYTTADFSNFTEAQMSYTFENAKCVFDSVHSCFVIKGNAATHLYSLDLGDNWTSVSDTGTESVGDLNNLIYANESIWALYDNGYYANGIYKDPLKVYQLPGQYNKKIYTVAYKDNYIYFGGENLFIRENTTDGTFSDLYNSLDISINSINVEGTNILAVGTLGKILYSTDGTTWDTSTNTVLYENINCIKYVNDTYVCVGDNGLLLYSTDGLNWNQSDTGQIISYTGLTYGAPSTGDRVYIVGGGTVLYKTSDLNSFTLVIDFFDSKGEAYIIRDIQFFNNRFIILFENGYLAHSSDLNTFTYVDTGIGEDCNSIAWNGNTDDPLYVICTTTSTLNVMKSTNLTDWEYIDGLPTDVFTSKVRYGEGQGFVIGGNNSKLIYIHDDGVTLEVISFADIKTNFDIEDFMFDYTQNKWIFFDTNSTNIAISASPSETPFQSWDLKIGSTPIKSCLYTNEGHIGYMAGGETGLIQISNDGENWELQSYIVGLNFIKMTYGSGLYIAIDSNGYVFTSRNRESWGRVNGVKLSNPLDITAGMDTDGNPLYIIITTSSKIYKSNDGNTWTEQDTGYNLINAIAYNNNLWVICGNNGLILTSIDGGETWTKQTPPTGMQSTNFLAASAAKAIIICGESGNIAKPSNSSGTGWTKISVNTGNRLQAITSYNNNKEIIIGGANGLLLHSSDEGNTFNQLNHNLTYSGEGFIAVAYSDGLLVAGADNGTIITGIDGFAASGWSKYTYDPSDIYAIFGANNMFTLLLSGGVIFNAHKEKAFAIFS
jgi:hypothetical protein